MSHDQTPRKPLLGKAAIGLSTLALAASAALSIGLASAGATPTRPAAPAKGDSFSFKLVPSSPAVRACLPHAGGNVTITHTGINDTMTISVHGMPPGTGFDAFVIQLPTKPFGVSWYQTDVRAGASGSGSATVRGVFSKETFSVSPGGTTTFAPTHQFHIGLWWNNPSVPFNIGCEPGATAPIVTPFNGEQHAGIQALNTSQFPVNKGPLSHVK
ncbi:MAG TPA: hypothetical protein VEV63_07920 [Streptosporangiaceae bacterium]|nr:hypothetical protein [Streptosporangiaceae bacterium]